MKNRKEKFDYKFIDAEIDRSAKKVVRKGTSHEEHLPRYGLPLDDDYLKESLERAIDSSPLFDATAVTIEVKDKRAIIHGKIPDRIQHGFLIEAVKRHEGIDEVEDHTSVAQEWATRRRIDPQVAQDYD